MHWTFKTLTILALAAPLAILGCKSQDHKEDGSASKQMHDQGSMTDEQKDQAEGSGTRY